MKSSTFLPEYLVRGSNSALVEMLRLFIGELSDDVFNKATKIICRELHATRVFLVRYNVKDNVGRVRFEHFDEKATNVSLQDWEFKVNPGMEWLFTSDENIVCSQDLHPAVLTRQAGENGPDLPPAKSFYVFRFKVALSDPGMVCIVYEQEAHQLTVDESKLVVDCLYLLQLGIECYQREEELRRERDRAREADRAKSYFFSTVSHDIRTPLNAIVGFAEMLKLGTMDENERKCAIDSIIVSSRTLLQLINDVLDLSKLEAGQMEIVPAPTDVRSLISDVTNAFQSSVGDKPLVIKTEVDNMPFLHLDPQRIRQILFNLVGNAVKFTSEGSITVSAKFHPGEDAKVSSPGSGQGTFHFSVADTGCGIKEEDIERIVQPYIQVGAQGMRNGGTGLGLTICRDLISCMNGEIELESEEGKGATFYVSIPNVTIADDEVHRRLTATQKIKLSISDINPEVKRVLIVDDSPVNLSVLKAMLRRFGINNVTTAANGKEALMCMRSGVGQPTLQKTGGKLTLASEATDFDIVFTDMWMPEMDGEAFVTEVRKNPCWKSLPVYAVTADVEARKNYQASGFTGVLLKPLTFDTLSQALNGKL